jgi:hypothetical protein
LLFSEGMKFPGRTTLVSLLFVTPSFVAACSSTSTPAHDESTPSDASQLSDAGKAVWQADSTGFELRATGGSPDYGLDGAACTYSVTWRFDATSGALTRTGQSECQTVDAAVVLGPAAAAVLDARLTTLLPTFTRGCGADAPEAVFTVLGAAGARHSYPDAFYAGCATAGLDAGTGPFVDDTAIEDLSSLLGGFVDACRNADAGAPVDAGVICM